MKQLNMFFRRLMSFMADMTIALFIYCIISLMISNYYYIPIIPGYLVTWSCYSLLCYCIWRKSFGTMFFGYKLESINKNKLPRYKIIIWSVFTGVPIFILFLSLFCYYFVSYARVLKYYGLIFFVLLLLWGCISIFRKKIFGIVVNRSDVCAIKSKRRINLLLIYIVLLILGVGARYGQTYLTNTGEVNIYTNPRPSANSVNNYVEYLSKNRQNINDYIFSLFEKYDHVILCERLHNEYTQWNMIYDIVNDDRFENVKAIFTEVGNFEAKEHFEELLSKTFPNDTILEKELARFMTKNQSYHPLWNRTNLYDFLKKVYYHNRSDSSKIDVTFTAVDRVKYPMSGIGYDSIMASNIIKTVKSGACKKSLIVMNYRHAYLHKGNSENNCGAIVNDAFPNKVANVLINTISPRLGSEVLLCPIQNGKWDVAFEQMPDSAFAFGFKESPFGKDDFDHSMIWFPDSKMKYEDCFNGFIYYLPLKRHILKEGYPYMLYGENENVFLKRYQILQPDSYSYIKEIHFPYLKRLGRGGILGTNYTYFQINRIENYIIIYSYILSCFIAIMLFVFAIKSQKD